MPLNLSILATYGPPEAGSRSTFWHSLHKGNFHADIIAGDLNVSEDPSPFLTPLTTRLNLTDAATALNNRAPTFKHHSGSWHRIDRFLVGTPIIPQLRSLQVMDIPPGLDHAPVVLTLGPDALIRAPSLHTPPVPRSKLEAVLLLLSADDVEIPANPTFAQWTAAKRTFKNYLIKLSHNTKSDPKSAAKLLLINTYNVRRFQLSDIPLRKIKTLESQRSSQQRFTAVRISGPDSPTTSDPEGMRAAIHSFYSDLYANQPSHKNDLNQLLEHCQDRVTQEDYATLSAPFSTEQISKAISALSPWKAPGPDGIPAIFYRKLADHVAPALTHMFNNMLKGDRLPAEFKSGITTLLMKKGDPSDPANRRPITLLNTDYKILSRALTNRLLPVIPKLVSPYQTGFVPGRYIIHNVAAVDIFLRDVPSARVDLIDFKKAYDSISHKALKTILRHLNFPPNFTALAIDMIAGSTTRCIVNGTYTDPILLCRGVKQGDPISPLLFNLAIDPLAKALTAKLTAKDFPRVLLYADDLAILRSPSDDQTDIPTLLS